MGGSGERGKWKGRGREGGCIGGGLGWADGVYSLRVPFGRNCEDFRGGGGFVGKVVGCGGYPWAWHLHGLRTLGLRMGAGEISIYIYILLYCREYGQRMQA